MKKLIAVAVLATTTSVAFAADRAIYDVQYLPNAGTTYGQTEWQMLKIESEFKGSSVKAEVDGWALVQTVGHSFTDRLSVEGSINYADSETEVSGAGAGNSKTDTTGISDPSVQARFRVMDEAWRWDVIGGATISLGDSETDSDGDTDNLQGGHTVFVGTQIGQRWDKMQWAVLAQYNHNLEATTDDKTAGGDVEDESYGDWTLRADLLNQIAEKSFIRSHVQGNWAPKYDSEQPGGAADQSNASTATWDIGAQYQHLFSQDLLALAGVDYLRINSDSGSVDKTDGWRFTLGARYQF